MSKALQKHVVSHLPEGEGNEEDATVKPQTKRNDGKKNCMVIDVISHLLIFSYGITMLYHRIIIFV